MKKWYPEDWAFTIEVLAVGRQNSPTECRMGFEPGDVFECAYDCPAGFCSKSILKVFPILEVVRGGGDLRNLGGTAPHQMSFLCPDGVVKYRVIAKKTGGA